MDYILTHLAHTSCKNQVLAHQKQGPRATIGAARRALCYDGSEEPSPGPATYANETKVKAHPTRWGTGHLSGDLPTIWFSRAIDLRQGGGKNPNPRPWQHHDKLVIDYVKHESTYEHLTQDMSMIEGESKKSITSL